MSNAPSHVYASSTSPILYKAPQVTKPESLLRLPHLRTHLSVVLLEALAKSVGHGHGLLHAAGDAARLPCREGLGGEVVDAGDKAVIYEIAEELFDFVG